MSLRTPMRRVLGLGSAKHGVAHWYTQRLTAVAVALLGGWFLVSLIRLDGLDDGTVRAWLASPLNATLMLLLVLMAGWHAVLGVQVVIEDYVGDKAVRLATLVVIKFALTVAMVVGAIAVLRLALGVPA